MALKFSKLVRAGAIAAAALVLILLGLALHFSSLFVDANSQVNQTAEVLGEIRNTRVSLSTSAPSGLPSSNSSLPSSALQDQINRLADLARSDAREQPHIQELRALFADREPAGAASGIPPENLARGNAILDGMQTDEVRFLAERTRRQSDAAQNASLAMVSFCAALLVLGLTTGWGARHEFKRRETAERTLVQEKKELTRHTRQLALVSAGSELIQAALDEQQISAAVATVMRDLLPDSTGYLGLLSPSKDQVEVCASWGADTIPDAFPPEQCMALQLGRLIHRSEALIQISCTHMQSGADYICMPLRSASGHLGVLHVHSASALGRKAASAVSLFAAHVALGLTNLRMREALRNQSVRDSLTALFNRRYFDETLQRDLAHCRRDSKPLSVLMIDVDKFKTCNDTYGHAAGDEALRGFSRIMRSVFREGDVVCRYGGEEFAVIMAGASLQHAYARAESFRKLIAETELSANGVSIGRMTASIGVACSEELGAAGDLVRAADSALYHAKRMGRNATWVCSDNAGSLPAIPAPPAPEKILPPASDTSLTNVIAHPLQTGAYSSHAPLLKPPVRPS